MTWQPERPTFGAYEHAMPYVPRGTKNYENKGKGQGKVNFLSAHGVPSQGRPPAWRCRQ